jgi:hypothetical protein
MLFLVLMACVGCTQEDRSFYQLPDTKDWPGDALSEKQTLAAIEHFADSGACDKSWKWALIGPNAFLLKGTHYVMTRVSAGGGFVPNIHYSKGYWGGTVLNTAWIAEAKLTVQHEASLDCKYGGNP